MVIKSANYPSLHTNDFHSQKRKIGQVRIGGGYALFISFHNLCQNDISEVNAQVYCYATIET